MFGSDSRRDEEEAMRTRLVKAKNNGKYLVLEAEWKRWARFARYVTARMLISWNRLRYWHKAINTLYCLPLFWRVLIKILVTILLELTRLITEENVVKNKEEEKELFFPLNELVFQASRHFFRRQ